jgi:sensor histidine kinase YesM
MKPLKDKWLRIIGTPICGWVIAFGVWLWAPETHAASFSIHYLIIISVVAFSWYVCRFLLIRTRKKYPGFKESLKRFPISLVNYSGVILIVLVIQILVVNALNVYKSALGFEYSMKEYLISLITAYIVAGIYEALYFFEQWVDNEKAAERLKLEAMHSQLESLKNQVKPHFLFNSLNSLMALIDEDKFKAKKFLEELSRVYRYLLQSNEKELFPLRRNLTSARLTVSS